MFNHRHIKVHTEDFLKHRSRHRFFHAYKEHLRHNRHREFALSHRSLKFLRPVFLLVTILLIYLIVQLPVNKVLTFLIGLFLLIQIFQLVWMTHLEKRIFYPISQLHDGVKEISKGNYGVRIDNTTFNEIGFLIDSFNAMSAKLQEDENLKQQYEENRRMLIANISHDLKTPITAIQGYIEAIQDGVVPSPEKLGQYLQIINKNAAYINRLIDDLFLFSKLDMNQLDFQMETVSSRAFMDDLMGEFRFELQEKGFGFAYSDQTERDYQISLDRKRINQAIRNIIDNAVKHRAADCLNLTTRLYESDAFLCLDIRDDGPGIPPDKVGKIFDRFYRVDSERTKDLMSTGLGLAIAKELVEAHQGRITVESVVGEGTCFTLMLPLPAQERI